MHSLSLLALVGTATAQIRGFNYGALYADNTARQLSDWEADFRAAQDLPGVGGFTSARLFTMIQGYTDNTIISALPAAKSTNTSLLLGMWCSAGQDAFSQELTALKNAIQQYGEDLQDLIVGISIGSEDLYRISPTGIENESGPGAEPQQLISYIQQAKEVLQGTPWADKPIGHVDTWTAYVNGSNNGVIEALDWLGVDAYPYFETVNENSLENAPGLFFDAYDATVGASMGKPVWVTETGWPVTGPKSGLAESGTTPAETYWKNVACRIFGGDRSVNAWWYQLNDGADQETSFKVIPADRGTPLYDLSCPVGGGSVSSSTTSAAPTTIGSVTGVGSATATRGSSANSASGSNLASATSLAFGSSPSTSATPETDSPDNNDQNAGQPGASSGASSGSAATPSSSAAAGAPSTTSTPPQYTGAAMPIAVNAGAGLLLVAGVVMAAM